MGVQTMDLQNIQDQLNTEFSRSNTRIIFWFDDKGEYEDEVSELQLNQAKLTYSGWDRTGFTRSGY